MEKRQPLASEIVWIFVLRLPRERPIACFCSPPLPFSARDRTVRLDVRRVDHLRLGRFSRLVIGVLHQLEVSVFAGANPIHEFFAAAKAVLLP